MFNQFSVFLLPFYAVSILLLWECGWVVGPSSGKAMQCKAANLLYQIFNLFSKFFNLIITSLIWGFHLNCGCVDGWVVPPLAKQCNAKLTIHIVNFLHFTFFLSFIGFSSNYLVRGVVPPLAKQCNAKLTVHFKMFNLFSFFCCIMFKGFTEVSI